MEPLRKLDVAPLFRPLLAELVALLRQLSPAQWERPTVAGAWRVRDVAAHLVDGDLRKIAVYRDAHAIPLDAPIASDADLGRFINRLNASGVSYAGRLSPRLITDLLEITGHWAAEVIGALDPDGPALFPVSWAGEAASQNWMDTGREYTERWHHQAQIRDAVGRPRLLEPRWFEPLMDFSVRALPHAFSKVSAAPGTAVSLVVNGPTDAAWSVVRGEDGWEVRRGAAPSAAASVHLACDDAWRLFYNALPADAVDARVRLDGDSALARRLLQVRSVIL